MLPSRSGLVLLHLSPQHEHLPEYLAELGFDVAQSQWGLAQRTPGIIISDQPWLLAGHTQLTALLRGGQAGLIVMSDGGTGPPDCRPDATLPNDATGRELALAITLVGELCEQRQRLMHERDECQRWIDLAMHDPLTGLPNRRAWDKQLAQNLATKKALCIGLIDVDFFKQVNDRDGHKTGDAVLREAARVMRSQLRDGDLVARLGGDEFGVIIRNVDAATAETILDRMRRAVSADLARRRLPAPTLSAGYVMVQQADVRDAAGAFAAAASSLQAAKHQNRNRTVAYKPTLTTQQTSSS
jgi:diguanylate cyclase (GGDEF)-like protein